MKTQKSTKRVTSSKFTSKGKRLSDVKKGKEKTTINGFVRSFYHKHGKVMSKLAYE